MESDTTFPPHPCINHVKDIWRIPSPGSTGSHEQVGQPQSLKNTYSRARAFYDIPLYPCYGLLGHTVGTINTEQLPRNLQKRTASVVKISTFIPRMSSRFASADVWAKPQNPNHSIRNKHNNRVATYIPRHGPKPRFPRKYRSCNEGVQRHSKPHTWVAARSQNSSPSGMITLETNNDNNETPRFDSQKQPRKNKPTRNHIHTVTKGTKTKHANRCGASIAHCTAPHCTAPH